MKSFASQFDNERNESNLDVFVGLFASLVLRNGVQRFEEGAAEEVALLQDELAERFVPKNKIKKMNLRKEAKGKG